MIFSIIIPAFNEERFIRRTLDAIRLLHFPQTEFETIVVENGSMDGTGTIISEFDVRVIRCDRRLSPGSARNLGAKEAKGKYLAFLDADCVPTPEWLTKGLVSLEREQCATGAEVGVPVDAVWIERVWFSQKSRERREVTHLNAGNFLIARDLFEKVGGFDITLTTGEDYELCMRVKKRVPIIADDLIQVVHLGNPKTLKQFVSREIWHGLGALSSFKHNWYDKPLIATLVFGTCTLLQVFGLAVSVFFGGWAWQLFEYCSLGIFAVLSATVLYRMRDGTEVADAIPLFVLYYFYYLGRTIALGLLLSGHSYYRREK